MSNQSDCLFCKISKGIVPSHKIYEDNEILAFLDVSPVSKGHTLVIPKEHSDNMLSMGSVAYGDLMHSVHQISIALKKALGASGINISINNGKEAGQVIFHTHIHIIPRYGKDEDAEDEALEIICDRVTALQK